MKQHSTRTSLLALAAAVVAATALTAPARAAEWGAPAAPDRAPAHRHAATQAALQRLVDEGGQPGAVARAEDGAGTWSGTAGSADTATGRRHTADEHFRAASITKPFIATVLLQLEAEGRLRLDDTVDAWLPGVVRGNGHDGRAITLRQLLNHTSGIFNHTDDPDFRERSAGAGFPEHRYDTHRPEDLVAIAMRHPPTSAPGGPPQYSNTNYVLAGMVIQKATGHSYAHEVTRRILTPLRLTGTSFPGTDATMPTPHPVGYSRLHDQDPDATTHDATEQNMSWLGAAGELISTTGDLNRFNRALLRGTLLPPAQMAELLHGIPAGEGYAFGLGIDSVDLSCGVTVLGHTGRTNGSLSAMFGTPDGRHQLTLDINGDWLPDPALYADVAEAEFCGAPPARAGGVRSAALPLA
ncbi:serine hydrolase domain-containing protein [Streptomyces sp. NPDC039016]|uniref:serine hydrolase domain-containing protein n=1 Tax=Streptomyces sp. NPDC039016 TaxID=3154330 RepID=UPI0033E7EB86